MDIATLLSLVVTLGLGVALGVVIGRLLAQSSPDPEALLALETRAADQAVVKDSLDRLHDQMRDLEGQRTAWQAQLHQQVDDVRHSTDLLRRETTSLSTALRKPQVRGRWGEMHLRKSVELAGLVARCDFNEQVSVTDSGVAQRPDLVVNLAGGKQVVVDSKVPLAAFLDAIDTDDEDEKNAHLNRHARQFKTHIDSLSAKSYWRSFPTTPEFVVLFVPGESFLAAALESDADLIEYAAVRKIVLATPTTLIALLRTIAHAWTQEALSERADEIHRLGRELHDRLGVLGAHFDKVGRALNGAVTSYNQALGSLETRVLVTARKFEALEVTDKPLLTPTTVEVTPRSPSATELVEDARTGVSRLGVASEESA